MGEERDKPVSIWFKPVQALGLLVMLTPIWIVLGACGYYVITSPGGLFAAGIGIVAVFALIGCPLLGMWIMDRAR